MPIGRVALRSSALVSALVLTTACLPGGSDDAGGDDTSGGQSPSTSTSTTLSKGGQPLTERQLKEALPTGDEIPGELVMGREDTMSEDPTASSDPAVCRDLQLDGDAGKILDEETTIKAQRDYDGRDGGIVSVQVTSHDAPVPEELFDDADAAQSTCTEFAKTDRGETTTWTITPAKLEPMGDRTYVVGLRMLDGDEDCAGGHVRLAGISIGHNLIYIIYTAGPESRLRPDVVDDIARATVDNLEEM